MNLIENTQDLNDFIDKIKTSDFIAIDTEFIREKTYYPKLCLIQISDDTHEAIIDPLADDIDLSDLFDLMQDDNIVKVFHAGRQDIEIFYNLTGKIPKPIFDTQIAGMVSGFGDQIGYAPMVKSMFKVDLDKSSRFTDWANRPLTEQQLQYAIDDVTYLCKIYLQITPQLNEMGRDNWARQEMEILTSNDTYNNDPYKSWEKIRTHNNKPKSLAVLREVAAWRESFAQEKNIPKNHVFRDEILAAIASSQPKTTDELSSIRGIHNNFATGKQGHSIVEAVLKGLAVLKEDRPVKEKKKPLPKGASATIEILKLLLKIKSDENNVAAKLIANSSDLEKIATSDNANVPAMRGWRFDVFGQYALDIKNGKLAIAIQKRKITLIECEKTLDFIEE